MKSIPGLLLTFGWLLMSGSVWSQSQFGLAAFNEPCGFGHKQERLLEQRPELRERLRKYREEILPRVARDARAAGRRSNSVIRVPVVVHVIHNAGEAEGEGQNLSAARIQAQIDVLNEDFTATNPEFGDTPTRWEAVVGNPQIEFCLAAIDPDGNPTTGITRHVDEVTVDMDGDDNIETELKPAYNWDPNRYYNIYTLPIPGTTAGGGTTGYAFLPFPGSVGNGNIDGSVVDYRWFGGPGFGQSGYRTLTHETGHYLGLYHPFGDNSCNPAEQDCGSDDGLDDTPNVDRPTSCFGFINCNSRFPAGPSSCSNEHLYINYMDYAPDACQTSFTNDQINIMRAVLTGSMNPYNWASRAPLADGVLTACTFNTNDAAVAEIINPGIRECDTMFITPQARITNFGIDPLSTLTISYLIDNGAPVTFIWIDNLASGASATVDLPVYQPPAGAYEFTCYTSLPNGMPDENTDNDTLSVNSTAILTLDLPLFENFDDPAFDPTLNGIFAFNPDADTFAWRRNANVSAFGSVGGCAEFDNYSVIPGQNPSGKLDVLFTQIYDFSAVEDAELTFDLAYAPFDATFFDSLLVLASTDCGTNFEHELYRDGNLGMATAPATTVLFVPGSDQWRTETIDLSAFNNTDNITFAFINFSGYGQKLYLDNINITPACFLTAQGDLTDASCNGECDGEVTIAPDNGTEPYDYLWDANSGNQTTATATGLCAGTYDVTVTDADGCSGVFRATIAEPDALTVMINSTDPTNGNNNDGTLISIVAGGIPGCYTYAWSNSETTDNISDLPPGTYTVTVTDCNGCTATETVSISSFDCTGLNVSSSTTDVDCNGDSSGAIDLTATGASPLSYAWTGGLSGANPSNLAAGVYSYTVTDANACTFTETLTINEPDQLTASVSTTNVSAVGADDGTASATPGGGTAPYTYDWGIWGTGPLIEDLAPGVYSVTITDANGCTAVDEGEVQGVDCGGFTIASEVSEDASCAGNQDGSAGILVTGGTEPITYQWDDTNLQTDPTAINLGAGSYTVIVTDANSCTLSATITVGAPDALTLEFAQVDTVSCFGGSDGGILVQVSGGTPDYTYAWDAALGNTNNPGNLSAGTYCCTVTDANGCSIDACVSLPEPDELRLSYNGDTSLNCFGDLSGSISFFALGGNANTGYVYEWSPDVWSGGMTTVLEDLVAGTYRGTVTDGKGCTATTSFEITQPAELIVNATATPETLAGANDGTVSATASGGTPAYTYDWGAAGAAANLSNLMPGPYTVTVTDANGCEATRTVIVQPAQLDCSALEVQLTAFTTTCSDTNDGEVWATPSGGLEPYEYQWSNAANTAMAMGFGGGIATVTVTDANNCVVINEIEVPSPDPLDLSFSFTPESMAGAGDGAITATASGGTPGYSYDWFNATTGPLSGATISSLNAGAYSITVTDANGCSYSPVTPVELELGMVDCADLTVEVQTEGVTCFGLEDGSATATASGGEEPYTYDWGPFGTGTLVTDLPGGTINLTITDANNCTLVETVEIFEPNPLTINILATNESSAGANDGSIAVAALGGTPDYTYDWEDLPGMDDPSDRNNLAPGTYNLTVTDANGCSATTSATVGTDNNDCATLSGTIQTTPVSCFGDEDGTATVFATGGTEPYSYLWINSDTTATADSLEAGTVLVTIVDAAGCVFVAEGQVNQPLEINIMTGFTNETTAGANDGTATAMAGGGTPPYTYDWQDLPGSNDPANRSGLAPGQYTVVVTDANGCTGEATVTIGTGQIDCSSLTSIMSTVGLTCNDSGDGIAAIVVTGGTPPYEYLWSNGDMGVTANNLPGGLVEVTVTDAQGCVLVNEVEVPAPDPIEINIVVTNETVAGFNDGPATATASGGTPPYSYDWGPQGMGAMVTDLPPGTYVVEVVDASGCRGLTTATIEPGLICTIAATFDLVTVSCTGEQDGTATATAVGGEAPYIYNWGNGDTGPTATNLPPGPVMVTISDNASCVFITEVLIEEPLPLELMLSSTDETVLGNNDGTATATASGGTPPYSYDWGAAGMGATVSDLAPGTYSVTVTDDRGCQLTAQVTIEPGDPDCSALVLSFEDTQVLCAGEDNGTATAVIEGGTAPYTYDWSNGGMTSTITDGAGTYTVIINDAVGCESQGTVTILEPPVLLLNVVGLDGECGSLGTVVASVNGGVEPYAYAWSTGADTEAISGLTPGTYSVTVTDANGCVQSGAAAVTVEDSGIDMEVAVSDVTCFGQTDGSIQLGITRGVPPFEVEWSNGATGTSLSNLAPGTYTVQVTDAIGCVYLRSIVVESPVELSVTVSTMGSDPNGSDGTATALVQGGLPPYSYLWSTGATGATIGGLGTGSYSVLVTDRNGCSAETTFDIFTTSTTQPLELAEWSLAPNPSSGRFQLHVVLSEAERMDLTVYDLLGRVVWAETHQGQQLDRTIDLFGRPAGTYYLRLSTERGQFVRALVLTR